MYGECTKFHREEAIARYKLKLANGEDKGNLENWVGEKMKYYIEDNYNHGKLNDFVFVAKSLSVVISPSLLLILFKGRMNDAPTMIKEHAIKEYINVSRASVNASRSSMNFVGGDVNDGPVIPTKW